MAIARFGGIVVAGGNSRRMGEDKAAIVVGGVPMLQKAVSALLGAGAQHVSVVGGTGAGLVDDNAELVEDRWPGEGPLGALVQMLDEPGPDVLVVLSCDLATPSSDEIARLVAVLGESEADVAVSTTGQQRHWLHAAWRRSCREVLARSFADGERSIRGASAHLGVLEVEASDPTSLVDIDSPDDLRRYPGG